MTSMLWTLAIAVLLGGALGAGLWSILAAFPRFAAPRLVTRVSGYVTDVTEPLGRTPRSRMLVDPASGLVNAARSLVLSTRRRFVAVIGGEDDVRAKLTRAGWRLTVEEFRGRQLVVALACGALAAVLGGSAVIAGTARPAALALVVVAAIGGFLVADVWLTRAVTARKARIEDELPTVLDFLALCLAAGESLPEAVARTGDVGSGALAEELRRATSAVATGTGFTTALTTTSERIGVARFSRAVDQIVSAVDRGAPIATVLRDQATDAREDDRRRLLESAGRKEIVMLFPLVFLILPLSVLMAAFPGFALLQGGFG